MAPTFLKGLRRRSQASFRTERSTDTSSEGAQSHGTEPSSGSLTPPSISQQSDPALNLQVKEPNAPYANLQNGGSRPASLRNASNNSSRNSVSGMSGLGAPAPSLTRRHSLPISQYAPRVLNISDNAWVNQKVLLVYGTIGEATQRSLDGTVTVSRLDDSFPSVSWPVCDSHFKALIYLQPGPNKIKLDFSSHKLPNSSNSNHIHASFLTVHMIPAMNAPPLQLAILLARDSPATFDSVPPRADREGYGLEAAVRKFRMAAYLWQAFTAEQMWRHKLGRRVFRFEEEWTTGTSNHRDRENGWMRSEARIHIIRCDKTVAELRDMNKAQQNSKATDKDALFGIAVDAVRDHFNPLPGQKQYVSMLILDTHWDKQEKTIRGHAALGGGTGDLHLAIFGSHCLHSYPTSLEEVVPAFTDCTPTDTNYVANDCNEAGSSWEAANIGIGAHLHETGHLFGSPHQDSGIMLRDYLVLNRTFVVREAFCTRTKSKGGLALQRDECGWHRLDVLRFRAHPCFRIASDPPMNSDESVQAFPAEGGNILVTAATGIAFIEVFADNDDLCHAWMEYLPDNSPVLRQITLTDEEVRNRLPAVKRKGRVKIVVHSHGGGSFVINDIKLFASKESSVKLGGGKVAFRGNKLGESKMNGTQPQEVVFNSAVKSKRVLARAIVYHGSAVDGIEFVYDDDSTQVFGKKGGKEGGDVFEFGKLTDH